EFLRLDCALAAKKDGKGAAARKARWQELRGDLDPSWLMQMARPPLENCNFKFRCPKKWDRLEPTHQAEVRFCDNCQENVYYCLPIGEAKQHARQGHCVAVDPGVSRTPGDLADEDPEVGQVVMGLIGADDAFDGYSAEDPPLLPKKPWWKFW